jgi:hypothetical protein
MPSLTITTRQTKDGARYVVRYRLGGRAYPIVHGGSFRTLREAKVRRDLVAGEIAAGRNPADLLRAMPEQPRRRTVGEWGSAMITSRLDISEGRIRFLDLALRTRITPTFGDRAPDEITATDVQEWIAALARDLAPRTVAAYWQVLAQVLDYAEQTPNPARHKAVRLPYADVRRSRRPRPSTSSRSSTGSLRSSGCPPSSSSRPPPASPNSAPGNGRTSTCRVPESGHVG